MKSHSTASCFSSFRVDETWGCVELSGLPPTFCWSHPWLWTMSPSLSPLPFSILSFSFRVAVWIQLDGPFWNCPLRTFPPPLLHSFQWSKGVGQVLRGYNFERAEWWAPFHLIIAFLIALMQYSRPESLLKNAIPFDEFGRLVPLYSSLILYLFHSYFKGMWFFCSKTSCTTFPDLSQVLRCIFKFVLLVLVVCSVSRVFLLHCFTVGCK